MDITTLHSLKSFATTYRKCYRIAFYTSLIGQAFRGVKADHLPNIRNKYHFFKIDSDDVNLEGKKTDK